jgi:RND superfamily putative drug exporter
MKTQRQDNITGRVGRWSAQHPKKAILGWLAFVVASLVIGFSVIPQKEIDNKTVAGPGESGQATEVLNDAFPTESAEQVLVQSETLRSGDPQFRAAVADVTRRLQRTEGVDDVVSRTRTPPGRSRATAIRPS